MNDHIPDGNAALKSWSSQQNAIFAWFATVRAAVLALIVRARAGTGKTTTILEAITHAPEAKILLAAFNKSIATELAARCKCDRAEVKTLHAVGFAFLRRHWPALKVDDTRGLRLARAACGPQAPDPMVKLVANLATKGKEILPGAADAAGLVELAYQFDLVPEEEWHQEGWTVERCAQLASDAMVLAQTNDGTIEFADMVYLPLALGLARPWWDMVVVDEAQDMSPAQILLARRCVKRGGRIVVVGDDRQAIYGFRGADVGTLDRIKAEYAGDELGLTVTYRCPKSVVVLAQRLVPDYQAAPTAPNGNVVLLDASKLCATVRPGEAVLSRKNAPLAKVCLGLLRHGTPAYIEGRKDVAAGLLALVRKLKARSIPELLTRLAAWVDREITRAKAAGKESRAQLVEDQAETLQALCEGLTGPAELTARIEALFTDASPADKVVCSSVHKAKGREWERVFILDATFYPGGRRADVEEQNIEYVAITRAKSELVRVQGEV